MSRRFHPRLLLGAEVNPLAEEVGLIGTFFLATETDRRPAFFVGTSSDRIGSPPRTQGYYATAAKQLPGERLSLYASAHWSEWEERFIFPAGAQLELGRGFSLRQMYDGRRPHLLLNFFRERYGLSLMWIWYERPGVSLSVGL